MLKKEKDGIPFYEFEIFQQFRGGLKHAVFTRHSDISSPSTVQTVFETNTHPIAFKNQLHGIQIHAVSLRAGLSLRAKRSNMVAPGGRINCLASLRLGLLEGDVLITEHPQIPLVIRVADCASILLFDPIQKVVANVHAGWRGLAKKIAARTVLELVRRFEVRPENIFAGISPMIGPCCCRFNEPKNELPAFLHKYILNENLIDLWSAAEGQLHDCGIPENQIENPHICTFCNPEDFFSYRREGDTGRFGTAIMLP